MTYRSELPKSSWLIYEKYGHDGELCFQFKPSNQGEVTPIEFFVPIEELDGFVLYRYKEIAKEDALRQRE